MPNEHYTINIRKRPWWIWLLAALWLFVEIVFLQTAVASHRESEPRAALISWIIVIVLAIAGVPLWRRRK
jgi:hypothetical protein